jgi:hypothetical protein
MFWGRSTVLILGSGDRGYSKNSSRNILYPITNWVFQGLFGLVRLIGPTSSVMGLLGIWGIIISPTVTPQFSHSKYECKRINYCNYLKFEFLGLVFDSRRLFQK